MGTISYTVLKRDAYVDNGSTGNGSGQPVEILKRGVKIRQLELSKVALAGLPVFLHFGAGGDPMPVLEGRVFADDADGELYDNGLYYSVTLGYAIPAATFVTFTIFQ